MKSTTPPSWKNTNATTALYIAAAPIDAPTVALAVMVENAGWGSGSAAPIARRVFDYLLLGQYPSEEDMALTRESKSSAPMGKPRRGGPDALAGAGCSGVAAAASAAAAASSAADRQRMAVEQPVFERPSHWSRAEAACLPALTARCCWRC
jgi:penicillin-binding protein 2